MFDDVILKKKIELDESKDKDIIQSWFDESKKVSTMDELINFIDKLNNDYIHDYGTIVHAMTAGCIATINMMNRQEQGGITGFQASCLMWEFISKFMSFDGPMKLITYSDMVYPQYHYKFEKTINRETWKWIQSEASKNLKNDLNDEVRKHMKSIVNGIVPFGYTVVEED